MSTPSQPRPSTLRPSVQAIAGMTSRLIALLLVLAALSFLPAGRWTWPEAWAYTQRVGYRLLPDVR